MTNRIRRGAVLASLASLASIPALAADPVPDSRYAGETTQRGHLRFEFRISEDGDRVERLFTQFRAPRCERAENGTQGSIRVRSIRLDEDGTFFRRGRERARLRPSGAFEGGTQIERFRIRGRFPTTDRGRGRLRVTVEVRNRAGETIDTCRMGRRIVRWSADRLGVDPDPDYSIPAA